ncbi:UNVERIFIED_CONTAM: hypothetical protein PYX00_002688 [Menopon gallinae]|uniref:Neutral ceramidase n=1 Tax=Menopon gallinae TaxID=328185 RepID=A0AAW2HY75_9NEOP
MKTLLALSLFISAASAEYLLGLGIADCTGPIAEIGFMGYGRLEQKGKGLHLRQWARSYIIDDGERRMVFVNVDVGMIGDALRLGVLSHLEEMFGTLYNKDNVIISGTHTHSAPGGFLAHLLFDLTILGFSHETYDALVSGIVQSIKNAHNNMQKGKIFLGTGRLRNASVNRSPTAYLENPEEERSRYESNVDTEMVQLKFVSGSGSPLGVINWFPVHPTSMNNTNTLVSSDNVGYASILFEQRMNPNRVLGQGPFVASFASSNLGDVSPNIKGPKCQLTGKDCDILSSTCETKHERCIASGPGKDMFESTAIIAERLFQAGWDIWNSEDVEVTGPVRSLHQYRDMSKAEEYITNENGEQKVIKGCLPAMGYSFAAGTTDGPGSFSFRQGMLTENPLWNIVRDFLSSPTAEDIRCQFPKPILLATGRNQWQPTIVSTQVVLIGNVLIACLPGEFTTMSGRRMRNALSKVLEEGGMNKHKVILAGLCNTYSDYVTTFEEYQMQRYEAASTIYGPHTLNLHIMQYRRLTRALLEGSTMNEGPRPPGIKRNMLSLITPVIYDIPKIGSKFGDVVRQPPSQACPGDIIKARFVSGHPRNNLRHGNTYCTIEKKESDDVWTVVATDANWETKVRWFRTSTVLGYSEIEVEWTIPETAPSGFYRIRHFGDYKYIFGGIFPYSGTSRSVQVLEHES